MIYSKCDEMCTPKIPNAWNIYFRVNEWIEVLNKEKKFVSYFVNSSNISVGFFSVSVCLFGNMFICFPCVKKTKFNRAQLLWRDSEGNSVKHIHQNRWNYGLQFEFWISASDKKSRKSNKEFSLVVNAITQWTKRQIFSFSVSINWRIVKKLIKIHWNSWRCPQSVSAFFAIRGFYQVSAIHSHWCHANMSVELYCKWKKFPFGRSEVKWHSFGTAQSFVKKDKDSYWVSIVIEILYANDELNYFLGDIFDVITGDSLPSESE